MDIPFWESGTFWTAVGTIVTVLVALGNLINWTLKRRNLARKKALESQFSRTQQVYNNDETSISFGQEETSLPAPQRKLSKALDAILNWWVDYSYDGRVSVRADEFDLDLHYRSEELAHNTKSYIAYIIEIESIYNFDIPQVRRKTLQLTKAVKEQGYDGGKLFVVFEDSFTAQHGKNFLDNEPTEDVQLYAGYLAGGRFEFVSGPRD